MSVDYRIGDTADVVATIPDGSVSLVASSPPFIALRSYLPDDHPDKHREIGSEPNPGAFLNRLLTLTAEWGRVLAPWGSLAIELGDTYSGSGGAGGDYNEGGLREGQQRFDGSNSRAYGTGAAPRPARSRRDEKHARGGNDEATRRRAAGKRDTPYPGWPRAKCLALIPQAYALSLAYGHNVITGQPSPAGQWLVRNVVVWHRPNPAVGALGDKVRPSTSYITVATRSTRRWFDLDAVRGEPQHPFTSTRAARKITPIPGQPDRTTNQLNDEGLRIDCNPAGAPPLDCWFDEHDTWTITTQPSSLAHYAMWPAKLAERLVLMMCPAEVCTVCGEPRRRLTAPTPEHAENLGRDIYGKRSQDDRQREGRTHAGAQPRVTAGYLTVGWSDCGHGAFAPGRVLDPFAGTGTTLAAADFHGRDAIGIDLDARNRDLYPARREEVARALNPTHVRTIAGQMDMFTEVVA